MSNNGGKEVIYVDIDDEITAIIDKVRSADDRIVALVLPKRATVFQSIVNMKLLKRSSDDAKKHLVLITSEAGLLPLAGAVGLYVAKSLQSKPEIPPTPHGAQPADEDEDAFDAPVAAATTAAKEQQSEKARSTGDYARSAATGPFTAAAADEETIELDNDAENELLTPAQAAKKAKDKKGKKFSIPNFNKFRLWLAIGAGVLLVLIIGWYVAAVRMPKASVTIKTDSVAVDSDLTAALVADSDKTDIDEGIIPAFAQKTQKTQSQQVEATGQLDKGTKASGQVTIRNCTDNPVTVPAGTGVSAGGFTFITQTAVSLGSGDFTSSGSCKPSGGHVKATNVTAQQVGEQYNLAARSDYKVASNAALIASGSAMTGGTSNIVKVISQADVDKAKQQLASQDTTAVKQELQKALTDKKYFALADTFMPSEPEVQMSAQVGTEADSLTVTQNITYSMLGVKQGDLEKLIANNVSEKVDPQKQRILSYGIDEAVFNIESQSDQRTTISMQSTVVAGSQLDLNAIKKQIAGKKSNEAKEIIQGNPGVKEVTVEYSPFWVSSIPKNTGKISLDVEKPQTTNNASDDE